MGYDTLIIGGGVVGLSLADELSRRGERVLLLERGSIGRETSWAGAGILPPASRRRELPPWEQLRALSLELHADWARRLRDETGIDNEFRRCGGIYVARSAGETAALAALVDECERDEISYETLSQEDLIRLEPQLAALARGGTIRKAVRLADECQIRNPRHLQALHGAAQRRGVEILENVAAQQLQLAKHRVTEVITSRGNFTAEKICLTTGTWTETLASQLGVKLSVYPIRGQMLLFKLDEPILRHVYNEGPRYLVPREDGHVLAGSTEEDVGFAATTTADGLRELEQFAAGVLAPLTPNRIVKSWAGLRPHSIDGFPYLGRVPQLANAFIAAGHYRSGLYTSPGTAVVMSQLMLGEQPAVDLAAFRLDR